MVNSICVQCEYCALKHNFVSELRDKAWWINVLNVREVDIALEKKLAKLECWRERGLLKCPNYRGNSFIMWVVCVEPLEYISRLDISNSVSSKIYIRTGLEFKILDYSKCHQYVDQPGKRHRKLKFYLKFINALKSCGMWLSSESRVMAL